MKCVLNVGAGDRSVPIPAYYQGWREDRLDIDPAIKPDVLLDARELQTLAAGTYDAVYCAHNLEHYHRHEGVKVLKGFAHILRPEGFAEIRVPDLAAMMKTMAEGNLDIDDTIYVSPRGPIMARDMIYGYHKEIEELGNEYYAHKTGFTCKSLARFVAPLGFPMYVVGNSAKFEVFGFFFKQPPTAEVVKMLPVKLPTGRPVQK